MTSELLRLRDALAGRYEIERELGRGGMATVYLARDPRHERSVAVKVLHPDLAAALGAERFLAEIRTTANLQHPHILPLHDSGDAGGHLYYVMPFIDGETLRARLEREGPLPIDDAIRVTREVLGALDYAHRRGVVHRDVKPENVLLHDGSALVADFGIALAVQTAGGARMTQTGLSLGTPSYMSPEQAMGEKGVDARSDVYAVGAMLYEMLTGEPPFTGPSVQAIVAKLMTERPTPPSTVRDTVPRGVEAAVLKALARLPADRFATAGDFATALQHQSDTGGASELRPPIHAAPRSRSRIARALVWAPWVLASLLIVALAALLRRPAPAEHPVVRTHLDLPAGERVMVSGYPIILSPAGDRVAYVTSGVQGYRTFVRRSDELVGRLMAPTSLQSMTFSRDGRWLVYAEGREIRKMPADGGAAVAIGTLAAEPQGICWTSKDEIVIGTSKGVWVMPAAGGEARRVTSIAAESVAQPVTLADGNTVFYTTNAVLNVDGELAAASLDGGPPSRLGIRGAAPLGVVDNHLLYTTASGALMAVPFDATRRRTMGDPVQIERGINGAGLSASGSLVYLPGASHSVMVGAGRARDDASLFPEARNYIGPRFSPDGRRIAVGVKDSSGEFTRGDIWVYDVGARSLARLTTDGLNGSPEWSPDGSRILYRTVKEGKYIVRWQRADGGAPPELLYAPPMWANEAFLSPDGKWLVYRTSPNSLAPRSIFAAPLAGGPPILLVGGPASHTMPRLSPDGRWLAYQSDESGRFEIYVRPFPGEGPRVQVSTEGGTQSMWSRKGGTLYFRTARGLVAAAVVTSPGFTVRDRRTVLIGDYMDDPTHQNYDVSPVDESFVMLKPEAGNTEAVIVYDWVRELRARLARERGR